MNRGKRHVGRLDLATADWQRNEHGVDVLTLSRDELSGAITFALRTTAALRYPERQHFYDCEQELFQFEGEFHHDRLIHYREGDYVYRPVGTVYGDEEGSDDGGIIVAALARRPVRFHFDDHPEPWQGHYRVDRLWCERGDEPCVIRSQDLPWCADASRPGVRWRILRGAPGSARVTPVIRRHSPWAADAALMLQLPAGYRGEFPAWRGFSTETLICSGQATIGGEAWYRGCYAFGGPAGRCDVQSELTAYVRLLS